jgi:outer membrane protein OmpA-like peptidoglycan-associated protein
VSRAPRASTRRHVRTVAGVVVLAIATGGCRGRIATVATPAGAEPPAAASLTPASASPTPAAPTAPAPPGVMVVAPDGHAEAIARRVHELAAGASGRLAIDEVGYYMDVQQARLQKLGTDRVRVVRRGATLVLTLVAGSGFESGSFRLAREAEATLAALAGTLCEFEKTVVSVHGHTDASGGERANLALSERRALAVARVLIDNGVDRRRLVVVGRGQLNPVASNETEEGRERNRRVEVHIDPIQR